MEKKNLVMVALCVAIGVMAIAYAAFATTLNVNGTINAAGTFAVTFTAPGTGACTGTAAGADIPTGTVTATAGATTATISVSLYTPGDTVTCKIPVKNTGNLKAKYVSSSISNSLTATSSPIAVSVTNYTANLAASATGTVDVLVRYNWSGSDQPTTTSKTFTVTTQYTQDI